MMAEGPLASRKRSQKFAFPSIPDKSADNVYSVGRLSNRDHSVGDYDQRYTQSHEVSDDSVEHLKDPLSIAERYVSVKKTR